MIHFLYFLSILLLSLTNSTLAMESNLLESNPQQYKKYRTNNNVTEMWTAQIQKGLQAYDEAQIRNKKIRQALHKLVEVRGKLSLPVIEGASTPLLEIARIITMGYEINQNFSQSDLRLLKNILDLKQTSHQSFLPGEGTQALDMFVSNIYGVTRMQTVYLMLQHGCPDLETEEWNPLLSLVKYCFVLPDEQTHELIKILVRCGAPLDKPIADPKLYEIQGIDSVRDTQPVKYIKNCSIMELLSQANRKAIISIVIQALIDRKRFMAHGWNGALLVPAHFLEQVFGKNAKIE